MKEPRSKPETGSREKSVQPGPSPEPAPVRAVLEDIGSRGERADLPMSARLRQGPLRQRRQWPYWDRDGREHA
jgi:hypothetical protein